MPLLWSLMVIKGSLLVASPFSSIFGETFAKTSTIMRVLCKCLKYDVKKFPEQTKWDKIFINFNCAWMLWFGYCCL